MGFYNVTLQDIKHPEQKVNLLFPSSAVKELFPLYKVYGSLAAKKAIVQGIQNCMDRLEEKGDFCLAGIPAMVEILKKEIEKIETDHIYKVTESDDALKAIKKSLAES